MGVHRLVKRDRVLERELRAGADRPVRGVRGVAEEHRVGVMPAHAAHDRELAPERAVREHRCAVQLLGEEPRDVCGGRLLVLDAEAARLERRVGGLDDQRALARRVHVGVQVPDPRLVLAEAVGESRQGRPGAEPHEAVRPRLDRRLQMHRELRAHPAVDAVGADDEVRAAVRLDSRVLGLEAHPDAERRRAPLQDLQQGETADPGEAVPARPEHVALEVGVDVVPVGEVRRDLAVARLVGAPEVGERLVGEHDAEAEGVVGAVALDHLDRGVGTARLHQDGEVQPGRAAADHVYAHSLPLPAVRDRKF